ncbi:hypothetical protein [Priestia endophytica]|uniref:hypothetical protein n=1 Tax=Priestia endophytica TaxID=135735 RepID=UPI000F53EA93|nr:hypothetical protein [Priestia endophytica]RPK15199.1 hypothetical protein FH5_00634 [Priestia endophytica]
MKKYIFLFMFCLLVGQMLGYKDIRHKELERSLHTALQSDVHNVNIASLTDFQWDKAYVFPPYTPVEVMRDNLGIQSYKDWSGLGFRDDINLLVFLHGDQIVHYAEMNIKDGHFVQNEELSFTPSHATLPVQRF